MFESATPSPRLEPTIRGQDNPFLVDSRLEILHILHAIMREATLITVNVDVNDFFLTSVLAIDDDAGYLYLERGRSRPPLSNVFKNRRLHYNTTLDRIKIRFTSTGIETVMHAGGEAYRVPVPDELARIQRREFYRVPTPIMTPLKCHISGIETRDGTHRSVELAVADISCGGVAVQSPPELFTPELGTQYHCTLLLPDSAGLRLTVQARNAFVQTLRSGKITQRCGFSFQNAPEALLAGIQRYILHLERQLRARAARER